MNVVTLLSGGMDSTALVAYYANNSDGMLAVSINYGQRHVKEIEAAAAVAAHYGIPHLTIDLSVLSQHLTSALTSGDIEVPDGHYAEETMRATVVPNRNAIMLMVAAGVAQANGMDVVATAVHSGDHFIYPDCRPEFIRSASETAALGTAGFGDITIEAPFLYMDKAGIATTGALYEAPFDLSWSCYKGGDIHCGSCGTCFERREAFTLARVTDPTVYAATPHYDPPEAS